jgi:outer membrane protein assembly factor BamB
MKHKILAVLCGLALAAFTRADDWPQFRGPDRTGVSQEKGLLKAWPKDGPKLAWTFKDAGLGFSAVAVVKGVVYTLGTDFAVENKMVTAKNEYVIAIDEKTGKELWRAPIGPIFTFKANEYGDGPRGTPTIDGNFLYALGGQGILVCIDLTTKKEVWRKDLINDLGGQMMFIGKDSWGYSESPLIDGPHVICTPGGKNGTLAALDKTNGKVVWRSAGLTHNAPYSSAVVAEFHGVRQIIQMSYINTIAKEAGFVSGIEAKSGKVLWSKEMFKGLSYGIATAPIVWGNHVHVSTAYNGSCHLFEIDKNQAATEKFSKTNQKRVKNNHGGLVRIGDYVYGHSDKNMWICQDLKTGDAGWDGGERNELNCVSGATTAADGMLYFYTDGGEAALVKTDPAAFTKVSSFTIPMKSDIPRLRPTSGKSQIWTHPVVANGRLYLRDHEYVFAFDIRAQ